MATDLRTNVDKSTMSVSDLVQFVKQELEQDDERQAKVTASGSDEALRESQTGATLDLSHKNIQALPVEILVLIKDKVERYGHMR